MLSGGSDYAGRRHPSGRHVQLLVPGSPGAQRSSPEAVAADGEPGLAGALPGLPGHVLSGGTPLYPPGEAAPGLAPPGVVHHPQ